MPRVRQSGKLLVVLLSLILLVAQYFLPVSAPLFEAIGPDIAEATGDDPYYPGAPSNGPWTVIQDKSKHSVGTIGWNDQYYALIGWMDIYIDGSNKGNMLLAVDYYPSRPYRSWGKGHTYASEDTLESWARALNGNVDYVERMVERKYLNFNGGAYGYDHAEDRIHIRQIVEYSGAWIYQVDENDFNVYLTTTQKPTGRISMPLTAEVGDRVDIRVSGNTFCRDITYYKVEVDGHTVVDTSVSGNSFSDTVTHTFDTPGNYTVTLTVTDKVQRSYTTSETITVGNAPPPPPPPEGDGNIPPIAKFDMPSSATVGDMVSVTDESVDPDGRIEIRSWSVSPGASYEDLGDTGGTLKFDSPGVYTVELTVMDNDGAMDSTDKTIFVEDDPPPPPPPPEPDARIDAPSRCGIGETVTIEDESTCENGYIVDRDWDITPSSGFDGTLSGTSSQLTFNEPGTYTIELTIEANDGSTDTDTEEITVINEAPKAKISCPTEVMQGEEIEVKSKSYDEDGSIVRTTWSITPTENVMGELNGETSTIWFDKEGEYTITLEVEDNFGKIDTDTKTITVEPCIPNAFLEKTDGTLKENRKVVFSAKQSISSDRYPILWDETEWQIYWVDGSSSETIKRKATADKGICEVLFKDSGDVKVRVRVKNAAGHWSEWAEKTYTIRPDLPPVADFFVQGKVARDPANNSKATIQIYDNSYSPDGDIIAERHWRYKFDSNNDGRFTDEGWVVLDETNNLTSPSIVTGQVGKYLIELSVKEDFYEETIPEFINADDYLWADTGVKPLDEKIVQVINVAPTIDFEIKTKPKVDVVFATGTPQPSISWINKYEDRSIFDQVIEAESDQATKSGSWSYNPSRTVVYLWGEGDSIWADFSQPSTSVAVQLAWCDHNDGIAEVYVDGQYFGEYDTNEKGSTICKIVNLPYASHTVKVRNGGGGNLHVDWFGISGNSAYRDKLQSLQDNLAAFESNLVAAGLDVNVEAMESFSSSSADAATIFNSWINFPDGTDHWHLDTGQGTIYTNYNSTFLTGFYDPNAFDTGNVVLEADVATEQLNQPMGLIFRQHNSTMTGRWDYYLLWLSHDYSGHTVVSIFKVQNDPLPNAFQSSVPLMAKEDKYGWWAHQPYDYAGFPNNTPMVVGTTVSNLKDSNVQTTVLGFKKIPSIGKMTWTPVKLEAIGNTFTVYVNGQKILAAVDNDKPYTNGTYGVFSYSNTGAYFKNFTVSKFITLDQIVRAPNFRPDALRFVCSVQDATFTEYENEEEMALLVSRLVNNDIDFSVIGSDVNKAQVQDIIARNDGNGTFIYSNDDMSVPLDQYADYIIAKADSASQITKYFILNEPVAYNVFYEDYELDPEFDRKWHYLHDPDYFENPMGLHAEHDKWLAEPITAFDKVGSYQVQVMTRDNPVDDDDRFANYRKWSNPSNAQYTIYVHRRPIADFTWNANIDYTTKTYDQYNIDFSGEGGTYAYWDPEFTAPNGETISTIEFETAPANDDYYRDQRVEGYKDGSWHVIKDYRAIHGTHSGAVSDTLAVQGQGYTKVRFYFQMYDSAGSAYGSPDGAYYKITTESFAGGDLQLFNHSYDLDHQSEPNQGIVEEEWKWMTSDETSWHSGKPSTLEPGKLYLVYLRVKDIEGAWSIPRIKVINTTGTNMRPIAQFTVKPNPLPLGETLSYNDTSYDPDGDVIVERQWWSRKLSGGAWVNHGATPPATFIEVGEYEIELRVRDNGESTAIYEEHDIDFSGEGGTYAYWDPEFTAPAGTISVIEFKTAPANDDYYRDQRVEGYKDGSWHVIKDYRAIHGTHSGAVSDTLAVQGQGFTKVRFYFAMYDRAGSAYGGPEGAYIRIYYKDDSGLWSEPYYQTVEVIPNNQKPVADFTVTPNPMPFDQEPTYIDNSYDPDGDPIAQREWQYRKNGGAWQNGKPTDFFSLGIGTFDIRLRVQDDPPMPQAAPLWSDWCTRTLQVVDVPIDGSGEMTPNPALSGHRLHITVQTEGYVEQVKLKFPTDYFFHGDEITLTPVGPVTNKYNTFKGTYLTDIDTPDGTYNITATLRRVNVVPDEKTVPLLLVIQGDIYDQVRVRIIYSR
ncbi:MAG: PKD domain-containing protein [Peptococcaceae bacterium]|nr:PKD domain-containing protein [Peptococcaceae bacterium]